jgi:carbon monoxide dehydrogenase subunit G
MNRFSATTDSEAVVAADRRRIWAVLTDPEVLPRLTPLLRRIETDGDMWRWELGSIRVLGTSVAPSFTEQMKLDPPRRIDFTHAPPPGRTERAGAEGWYLLEEVAGGTRLRISLTLSVDLPLARAARPAVERVMSSVMTRTGERFSAHLLRHLGLRA